MGTIFTRVKAHTFYISNKTDNRSSNHKIITFCFMLAAIGMLCVTPSFSFADATVTLAWDANDPAPDGYRLFLRQEGQSYNYAQWAYEGPATTCTLDTLAEDVTYYFVVRAFMGQDESGDSNEVSFRYEPPVPQDYTISATAGTGGSISPSGSVSVPQGADRSFTIEANTGYQISDVLVDGVSQGVITGYTFSNVSTNHTIAASFSETAPQYHTITATAGTGGSISPSGSVSVAQGADSSFTIAANTGYQISDVLVDGASHGDITHYTFSNVTGNHSIEAQFISSVLPPLADAGPAQEVASLAHVTLDGSGSSDPQGGGLTYNWTQNNTPHVVLDNSHSAYPEFTAPEVTEGTVTLRFELTVTNSSQLSASDTCLVLVRADDAQPLDTDGDGIPDDEDDDDDGDGMPDTWELQYGFDPLDSSDAALDPDNDGLTNLEEYRQGTDPLVANENQAPDQPTWIYPEEGDANVELAPRLRSSDFADPDENDTHLKTQWRVQRSDNQKIVYDITPKNHCLTSIRVPRHILDPGVTYTAQMRYYDNHELASEWSTPLTFTIILDDKDKNRNRIPDDQEVDEDTDLNNDGIPDSEQTGRLKRFKDYRYKHMASISIASGDTAAEIEAVADIDPAELDGTSHSEQEMPYGVLGYKIHVPEPGQSVRVEINLSEPIDPQIQWVRYDMVTGWEDSSDQVQMDDVGYHVERELVDGGTNDADGIANGVIVDLAGPQAEDGGSSLSLGDDAAASSDSSSCFIRSLF